VVRAAERLQAHRDEGDVVDGRVVADVEVAAKPASGDPAVAARVLLRDQRRQLEEVEQRGAGDLRPQRRLGDEKVAALDRALEDRTRMTLGCRDSLLPGAGRRCRPYLLRRSVGVAEPLFEQLDPLGHVAAERGRVLDAGRVVQHRVLLVRLGVVEQPFHGLIEFGADRLRPATWTTASRGARREGRPAPLSLRAVDQRTGCADSVAGDHPQGCAHLYEGGTRTKVVVEVIGIHDGGCAPGFAAPTVPGCAQR
jgi:hypothetical protein